jgi:hypothetical protein
MGVLIPNDVCICRRALYWANTIHGMALPSTPFQHVPGWPCGCCLRRTRGFLQNGPSFISGRCRSCRPRFRHSPTQDLLVTSL